ncbi:MAG: hypothetical protein AAF456_25550, partial [Planctomycetota bacterium]
MQRLLILILLALLHCASSFPTDCAATPVSADCFASRSTQEEERSEDFEIDKAQVEPVIVYDISGGFRMPDPAGFEREPSLQIFADGRVVAGRTSVEAGRGEWRIDDETLSELLHFVIDEQNLLDARTDEIRAAIDAVPDRLMIAD